ncbi:MAG: glycosyltransferase 87 family protein [Actinomycetota bacterium]|nr:glycosyltransferase 87 family protein [Actinomycetota bacterium]
MIACCLTVAAGFLLKGRCLGPTAFATGDQYRGLCYNDIQPLYGIRDVHTDTFPYVNAEFTGDFQYVNGGLEYPVLTGVFMWVAGLLVDDADSYLRVNALLMAPMALVGAYLLARMAGWRALMYAVAPPLVWYAFHNWDIPSVAATIAGLWAWHRGRPLWAAVWFGIGAALKLNPILFIVPLAFEGLQSGGVREGLKRLSVGAGTALAVNLPFMLINYDGWWGTYEFHRLRPPNPDSMFALLGSRFPDISFFHMPSLNLTVAALTLATFVVVAAYAWDRGRREAAYPFLQVCAAFLCAFMLWNKVFSPQYMLWLVPFFVVLNVHLLWWVAFVVIDAICYSAIFRWLYDISYLGVDDTVAKTAMITGIWARAGLLAVLIVVFLRSRPAPDPATSDAPFFLSYPPSKVSEVGVTTA